MPRSKEFAPSTENPSIHKRGADLFTHPVITPVVKELQDAMNLSLINPSYKYPNVFEPYKDTLTSLSQRIIFSALCRQIVKDELGHDESLKRQTSQKAWARNRELYARFFTTRAKHKLPKSHIKDVALEDVFLGLIKEKGLKKNIDELLAMLKDKAGDQAVNDYVHYIGESKSSAVDWAGYVEKKGMLVFEEWLKERKSADTKFARPTKDAGVPPFRHEKTYAEKYPEWSRLNLAFASRGLLAPTDFADLSNQWVYPQHIQKQLLLLQSPFSTVSEIVEAQTKQRPDHRLWSEAQKVSAFMIEKLDENPEFAKAHPIRKINQAILTHPDKYTFTRPNDLQSLLQAVDIASPLLMEYLAMYYRDSVIFSHDATNLDSTLAQITGEIPSFPLYALSRWTSFIQETDNSLTRDSTSDLIDVINPRWRYAAGDTFHLMLSLPYDVKGGAAERVGVLYSNPGTEQTVTHVNQIIARTQAYRLDKMGIYLPHLAELFKKD